MGDRSSKPGRGGPAELPLSGAAARGQPRSVPGAGATDPPNAAFDVWLERGLHTLFDNIAQEPIPDALLNIIEEDRRKR